jgi:hypothetical protein
MAVVIIYDVAVYWPGLMDWVTCYVRRNKNGFLPKKRTQSVASAVLLIVYSGNQKKLFFLQVDLGIKYSKTSLFSTMSEIELDLSMM